MASAYEKARLANIARNAEVLKQLGLKASRIPRRKTTQQPKRKARKASRKRKTPDGPVRRSTRNSGKAPVDYTGMSVIGRDEDEDSNFDDSSDTEGSNSESGEDWSDSTLPPPPKRLRASGSRSASVPSNTSSSLSSSSSSSPSQFDFLTIENAKTGRSSCRCCREKIEKGTPRIGMLSWIVGRNAMTWQHPSCFLSRICVAIASNGKSTCKASKQKIPTGQVKIGLRSHSTTAWVGLPILPMLMHPVLSSLNSAEAFMPRKEMEGYENLSNAQQKALLAVLDETDAFFKTTDQREKCNQSKQQNKKEVKVKKDKLGDVSAQPKVGEKTSAKGPVTWKFGAYLCHGTLLPSRETKTHCFARTHKGNVKTLKKGGTYWRLGD